MLSKLLQLFKVKELRNRLLIILLLLAVFRFFAALPIPGIDSAALKHIFETNNLLGFLNIFSGGALSNLSIVMLGLGPYITSTIIMQLLTMIFPRLKAMYYEEGNAGRSKFNRFSRYITVPLAALQGYGFLKLLASQGVFGSVPLTAWAMAINVITITAGAMILLWIGELITEQKFGNGVSIIIFAGIVSRLPAIIRNAYLTYTQAFLTTYIGYAILAIIVIAMVVIVNEAERKVPISYAKRIRGNKVYGGASSYLPLRINQAGVIPIIFAISILLFPQFFGHIVSAFSTSWGAAINAWVTNNISNNHLVYGSLYFILVFVFTYFYIAVTFDPNEISKNLQRSGGFIAGIRPGESTAHFLKAIISRITLFGATFLGVIAVLPIVVSSLTNSQVLTLGGTALLIVVSVALETAKQIDSQLAVREYEQ